MTILNLNRYMRNPLTISTSVQQEVKLRQLYHFSNVSKSILIDQGREVYDFLSQHIELESERTSVVMTKTSFNIYALTDNYLKSLVNFGRVNDIPGINRFFEAVNHKLPFNGHFACCAETKNERKARILKKYPSGLAQVYYLFDFIFKRIFPKLPITRKIYFKITSGRNRVLSRTEILGRLFSCGFKLVDEKQINGKSYFIAKKTSEPLFEDEPSYGMICKMRRFGKDGKIIGVYKFRTMHPYSEYLQQYVYETNNLKDGGKFKDDFRISTLGRFMRRYWIDEIPMLYNLVKGDIKLVGVRPLSNQYLNLYNEELKEKRRKHKPGLIPPFYADLPKSLNEIMASEQRYLESYEKSPFATDFRYLLKSCKHIILNQARSN